MTMNEPFKEEEIGQYLSTYQWVTVGQLLEGYGLKLAETSVLLLLRKKTSFLFHMLRVPVINVLSGIIADQIKAYRIYVQKIFVEYLVSGQADVQEVIGSETREALERSRVEMMELSEQFDRTLSEYEELIAQSQRHLIQWAKEFKAILTAIVSKHQGLKLQALYDLFADAERFQIQEKAWERLSDQWSLKTELPDQLRGLEARFNEWVETYEPRATEIKARLNQHRTAFYEEVMEVQNLLGQLSGFELDPVVNAQEREKINFDSHIGE